MNFEINILYWPDTPDSQIDAHRNVLNYFNLKANYHKAKVAHSAWLDWVCINSKADVMVFLDADCIPVNLDNFYKCIHYVIINDSFIGNAQASNHIPPCAHIFAAPSFFAITKTCWTWLNSSFKETTRSDVGQELSYAAEAKGKRYKCLYPTHFEDEPVEGIWHLGNYGFYGIGTVYENTTYHLYQGRFKNNIDRFIKRCEEVVSGQFSTNGFRNSKDLIFSGRICP